MGNILWLASYPKSGNTWMRAFLAHLLPDARRPLDPNKLGGAFSQAESSIGWYRRLDPRPLEQWQPEDFARARPRVHEAIAASRETTTFCKTHCAMMAVHGHPAVNMAVSTGAVYIVRNPLDVALSYADFLARPADEVATMMATENYTFPPTPRNAPEVLGSWSQHVASWTAPQNRRVHTVRYEDLLSAPSKHFRAVVRFLGLDMPRGRIERAIRHASFATLARQEAALGFSERPPHQKRFFRKGTAGQWRKELTPQQVERICAAHRRQMARFGYLPEGM